MDADAFIRKHIRKLLTEIEAEAPDPKPPRRRRRSQKGSRRAKGQFRIVSSVPGRIPKGLRPANPRDIMKNLDATGRYVGSDSKSGLEAIENLMSDAIGNADAMKRAYSGVRTLSDGSGREGVIVGLRELDPQNGARFLKITLEAARDAGMLELSEDIRVATSARGIVIYETPGGVHTWGKKASRHINKNNEE